MGFNSKDYTWSSCNIAIEGKLLARAKAVEYGEEIDRKELYGKGNKAQDIQDGNIAIKGFVEMLQSDFENILLLTGNKGIAGLRDMNITVAYAASDGRISTRSIIGAAVTEWKEGLKQGDTEMPVRIPFIALDVKMA
ncbi:hypothetical protein ACWA1C_06575 [Flectobacillus roseus]